MKILTWNIWYKEDPKNVLELLKNAEWDVCCPQEVMKGFNSEVGDGATHTYRALGDIQHERKYFWVAKDLCII